MWRKLAWWRHVTKQVCFTDDRGAAGQARHSCTSQSQTFDRRSFLWIPVCESHFLEHTFLLLNTRTSLSCIEISVFALGVPVEAHVWWWTGDSSSSKSEDAEFCCNRHSWQWNLSPRVPSILVCLGWMKWRTPAKKVVPASQRILSRLCTTRSSLACQRQNWRLLGTSSRHTAARRGKLNSEKMKSMHCYLSCTAGNWCERVHGGVWHAWHLLLLVLNHWASYLADGSTFDAGEVTC